VDGVILDMAAAAQRRLTALADQPGVARDQQARRDALHDFLRLRDTWIQGVRQAWQQALVAPGLSAPRRDGARDQNLTLIGEDEVENGILVSRLVLAISDKVSWELKDLRLRVASLEGGHELADEDVLKPDTFAASWWINGRDAASRATLDVGAGQSRAHGGGSPGRRVPARQRVPDP
jgi:hypothetical protein